VKKLLKGIIDFRQNSLTEYRDKFAGLVQGQSPDALMVACCDSRVAPNVFASLDPGDLFVLRNIGNMIPPFSCHIEDRDKCEISVAATIEFSLQCLEVKDIIICGHSNCGAIRTLMDGARAPQHAYLNSWLDFALSSYERFQHSPICPPNLSSYDHFSQINVLQQLDNLKGYPWVAERLAKQQLRVHGWWFDLATANVYHSDPNSENFILIDVNEAARLIEQL